ncbi:MAG: NAD(+) synthase [Pirellulaceae bacterium]|jgi:NAD+ synthase (glutamine-hydrolysing)
MNPHGFLRVTAASAPTTVADPDANRSAILSMLDRFQGSDIVVFQELSLTGYTCGDLFHQPTLLDRSLDNLRWLIDDAKDRPGLVVVGLPLAIDQKLYNVAAVLSMGKLLGIVPKQYLPGYQEFYEPRWFHPGDRTLPQSIDLQGIGNVPLGIDLLFESGPAVVGVELCEDLWVPVPPSSLQCMAGANVLLNLSASNELAGKAAYRTQLITSQSGRCCAAYVYASAGPGESTTDMVFGGHCLIAENGALLSQSPRVGDGLDRAEEGSWTTADVDLDRLAIDRMRQGSFHHGRQLLANTPFRRIPFATRAHTSGLRRPISGQPFIPTQPQVREERCREILGIQSAALAKRLSQLPTKMPFHIGVSGGLDSTLALLVAMQTCRQMEWPVTRIVGITLPGFGTSKRTLEQARRLMELLGITAQEIDIRATCMEMFRNLGHHPLGIDLEGLSLEGFQQMLTEVPESRRSDLVFENVQARVRTLVLMSRGFVLGTGDLSESALGWSTYNGDHMSMYNVNASVPKTLVRDLIRYLADHQYHGETRSLLHAIDQTPISPELLPLGANQQITQQTEKTVGPYELHDFFLYHLVRTGAGPEKLLYLASQAEFSQAYSDKQIEETLRIFLKRFFANQFKRTCVPDGPKVGTISLSPRADWRMPTDASVRAWLEPLERERPKGDG